MAHHTGRRLVRPIQSAGGRFRAAHMILNFAVHLVALAAIVLGVIVARAP
jgi:hypothetical protein